MCRKLSAEAQITVSIHIILCAIRFSSSVKLIEVSRPVLFYFCLPLWLLHYVPHFLILDIHLPLSVPLRHHQLSLPPSISVPHLLLSFLNSLPPSSFSPFLSSLHLYFPSPRLQIPRLAEVIGVAELVNKMNGPWFNRFDEDLATAFSIYCGISIAHVRLSSRWKNWLSITSEYTFFWCWIATDVRSGMRH